MIGKTVSHYRIVAQLGRGGMGVVFKAEDTRLKRPVALKFLSQDLTRDPDAKARFIQEARAASALDHPNIGAIYEIDQTPDGQIFIAMAFYDGLTLREKIAEPNLRIIDYLYLDLAVQIALGLAQAHKNKIVHRDIKPANIMITQDGLVKIVDFGLAKLGGSTQLTADFYFKREKFEVAYEIYQKILQLAPDNKDARRGLQKAESFFKKATNLRSMGKWDFRCKNGVSCSRPKMSSKPATGLFPRAGKALPPAKTISLEILFG